MTSSLPVRSLGRTGLQVTALGLGCSPLASNPDVYGYTVAENRALETLRATLESPINFIDTAPLYGLGESERRVGAVLRELGRDRPDLVLATKADRDPVTGTFDAEQVRRSIAESLRRLGVDHLQLVHLHDPEYSLSFEEAMARDGPVEALVRLRDDGVIGHVGIAAGPVGLLTKFIETDIFDVVLTHNRFTLVDQSARTVLDVASAHEVAVLNAAPYGGGILAKDIVRHPTYGYRPAKRDLRRRVARMDALCASHDVPLAAAALQVSLREPRIASTLVGMTRPERVEQTLALASCAIPERLWPKLAALALPLSDSRADQW